MYILPVATPRLAKAREVFILPVMRYDIYAHLLRSPHALWLLLLDTVDASDWDPATHCALVSYFRSEYDHPKHVGTRDRHEQPRHP
jgi:hypothetical protein